MTHKQVCAKFAKGETAEGGSLAVSRANGDAVVLTSYGTPIAIKTKDRAAYFSSERHSVTTSKQRTVALSACAAARPFVGTEVLDPKAFAALLRRWGVTHMGRAQA